MIVEILQKELMLYNKKYEDSRLDVSCDVKISDQVDILKTYGRCHRQIYYAVNNAPLENFSLNDKLRKIFLLSRKQAIIDLLGGSSIESPFDYEENNIGVNIYITSSEKLSRAHLIETFFCVTKSKDIKNAVVLYVDGKENLKEFVINTIHSESDVYPTVDGIPDESISLRSVNNRRKLLSYHLKSNTLPAVDYLQEYPQVIAKLLFKCGILSDLQYKKYLKEPFGDYECIVCDYKNKCKEDKNGSI